MNNEFYALSRVCRSQGKNPIPQGGTGACVTCKQRTSWVLRLHSCRALSPEPQVEPTTRGWSLEVGWRWKKGWSSVMQSV